MNQSSSSSTTTSRCSLSESSPRDWTCRRRTFFIPACLSRHNSPNSSPRRAITPDSTNPLVHSLESGRSLKLTEDDLDLIGSTWRNIPDKLLWCERLFLKLFSINKQLKEVMGYEPMTPKELMQCTRFELHCNRFIDFWQQIIDSLCAINGHHPDIDHRANEVVKKIREIGYLHCEMPRVTFDAESWLIFKNIILESVCWKQSHIRDPIYLCWSKLITFVVAEMKDAFHHGVRSRSHTF